MLNSSLILFGKTLSKFFQFLNLGNGSTWPGHIALKVNKHFIRQLLYNSQTKIIIVAGTNGKTTTAKMIQTIIEKSGHTIISNTSGANLLNGLASTLIANTNNEGKLTPEFAVFEVDENALPLVLKEVTPDYIVLNNLFRDQLDRYGEVNIIAEKWREAIKKLPEKTIYILNADDPQIAYIGEIVENNASTMLSKQHVILRNETTKDPHHDSNADEENPRAFYFGLHDKYLSKEQHEHAVDSVYCPKCGNKLIYKNIYYSHLGEWVCSHCSLKRPRLDLHDFTIYPLPGLYNRYNTLAAVLLANTIGVKTEQITSSVGTFSPAFGRQESLALSGREIKIFLSKNPTGFNESLRTIKELGAKHILLVLNDRIPDGKDVSWIWDTEIEHILSRNEHFFVSGDRVYDMALRLKYAGISSQQFFTYENLSEAVIQAIEHTPAKETLYVLPTYSAMLDVRKIITGRKIL